MWSILGDLGGGLVVVAVLAAAGRWAFGAPRHAGDLPTGGYGLLLAAVTVATDREAELAMAMLRREGVRATVAREQGAVPTVQVSPDGRVRPAPDRGFHVLVFPEDAARARSLVGAAGTDPLR